MVDEGRIKRLDDIVVRCRAGISGAYLCGEVVMLNGKEWVICWKVLATGETGRTTTPTTRAEAQDECDALNITYYGSIHHWIERTR